MDKEFSKIRFSQHARLQVQERNISEREIVHALKNPDRVIHQSQKRFRAVKLVKFLPKPYILVIAYDQDRSGIEVVTTFITSKVKKYLPS